MLITDADILAAAGRLARDLGLDDDDRGTVVLAMQRLVWPPSPWPFLHERPHVTARIEHRDDGTWTGEIRCPQGCARAWEVQTAHSSDAVYGALEAAHEEYRTGRATSVAKPPPSRPVSLERLLGRSEYVEVTDRHLTPEETRA
jgi:hypothetical protein